ncbi:MAG: OadG family protein [Selenomonadaceae bacterium]|nr:OadG family protein [Selenomonadaceae bacterium]
MEHSPVTTNPLIIMLINMTVVFIVLVSLIYLIKLIHFVDPTKVKPTPAEVEEEEPLVAVKSAPAPAAIPEPAPVVEEGINPEVIAAISAAITAYGFSGQVRAVRILNHEGTPWRASAKFNNLQRK